MASLDVPRHCLRIGIRCLGRDNFCLCLCTDGSDAHPAHLAVTVRAVAYALAALKNITCVMGAQEPACRGGIVGVMRFLLLPRQLGFSTNTTEAVVQSTLHRRRLFLLSAFSVVSVL